MDKQLHPLSLCGCHHISRTRKSATIFVNKYCQHCGVLLISVSRMRSLIFYSNYDRGCWLHFRTLNGAPLLLFTGISSRHFGVSRISRSSEPGFDGTYLNVSALSAAYLHQWTVSTSVQIMTWCRQATSHYLSQWWPWSLSPYGVAGPQWIKATVIVEHGKMITSHKTIWFISPSILWIQERFS